MPHNSLNFHKPTPSSSSNTRGRQSIIIQTANICKWLRIQYVRSHDDDEEFIARMAPPRTRKHRLQSALPFSRFYTEKPNPKPNTHTMWMPMGVGWQDTPTLPLIGVGSEGVGGLENVCSSAEFNYRRRHRLSRVVCTLPHPTVHQLRWAKVYRKSRPWIPSCGSIVLWKYVNMKFDWLSVLALAACCLVWKNRTNKYLCWGLLCCSNKLSLERLRPSFTIERKLVGFGGWNCGKKWWNDIFTEVFWN